MTEFGAVVVLYNPTADQLQNLVRVSRMCPCIVVVDNSAETSDDVNAMLHAHAFDYISNKNVGGIAGAFNRGLEKLEAMHVATFFLFDQDSKPDDAFFVKMLHAKTAFGADEVIIGPSVFDINLKRYSPRHVLSKWRYTAIPMNGSEQGLLPCSAVISSGSLITAAAYKKIGCFRERYFIDHIDTDFCLRAAFAKVPILLCADVVLAHAIGDRSHKKFMTINFRPNNHNPVRRYYIARNGFHLSFVHGVKSPAFFYINFVRMSHEFLGIILFEKNKFKKIFAMYLGAVDAILGRFGELTTLHKKIAAYLSR